MPLYDCMLLLKPHVKKEALMELVAKVGKHVCSRNGVIAEIKSFGTTQLGYGIRKLDGRYYQGQLMQMTMMASPNIDKELHYLNKEDRILRWLLVKHRNVEHGLQFSDGFGQYDDDDDDDLSKFGTTDLFGEKDSDEDHDDDEEEEEDEEEHEYDMDQENRKGSLLV